MFTTLVYLTGAKPHDAHRRSDTGISITTTDTGSPRCIPALVHTAMKPHIKLDRTKPNTGKWECVTKQYVFWKGYDHIRQGKGYTPREAYNKWSKAT